jgi:sensor domain CHASE-containing protein
MITFIGLAIIFGIFMYTYVELDRQEIQKRQERIQKDLDDLKKRIKVEEARRHEEFMNKDYDPQV